MRKLPLSRSLCVLLLFAVTAGCGGGDKAKPPPPPPTAIRSVFIASLDVNPDAQNRPSPLVVRLYELKSLNAFENAGFFGLFDNDEAVLGDELQMKDEYEFAVGEHRELHRELQPETRFIGVLAAYRQIDQAGWRASLAVAPNRTSTFKIHLNRLAIAIE